MAIAISFLGIYQNSHVIEMRGENRQLPSRENIITTPFGKVALMSGDNAKGL